MDVLLEVNGINIHIKVNSEANQIYIHIRDFSYFTEIFNKSTLKGKEYNTKEKFIHFDLSYELPKKFNEEKRVFYIKDDKDNKYVKVDNPKIDDVDKYYYKDKFGKAQGEFFDWISYYTVKDDNTMVLDETPTEEEYNNGLYYEMKYFNIKFEEVLTLTNTDFVIPKEITKTSNDIELTKDDFINLFILKDKTYLYFEYEISQDIYKLVMFDLEGNIIEFSDKYLFDFISYPSNDGLFPVTFFEENKTIIYILDSEFNLVHNKHLYNENIYINLLNSKEHIDYFAINTYDDNNEYVDVLEVRKYYLVSKDEKYNNKDMNFTLSANLKGLKNIFINDKEISKDNYTIKDNVLTLNNSYLSTIKKDTYKLKVLYNDEGYVNTDFIMDIANPNTGDNILKSFILGTVSLIGLIATIIYIKKRKILN